MDCLQMLFRTYIHLLWLGLRSCGSIIWSGDITSTRACTFGREASLLSWQSINHSSSFTEHHYSHSSLGPFPNLIVCNPACICIGSYLFGLICYEASCQEYFLISRLPTDTTRQNSLENWFHRDFWHVIPGHLCLGVSRYNLTFPPLSTTRSCLLFGLLFSHRGYVRVSRIHVLL